jgi:hypothetical protein
LVETLPKALGNEGWSFIAYLVLALLAREWTQGML